MNFYDLLRVGAFGGKRRAFLKSLDKLQPSLVEEVKGEKSPNKKADK